MPPTLDLRSYLVSQAGVCGYFCSPETELRQRRRRPTLLPSSPRTPPPNLSPPRPLPLSPQTIIPLTGCVSQASTECSTALAGRSCVEQRQELITHGFAAGAPVRPLLARNLPSPLCCISGYCLTYVRVRHSCCIPRPCPLPPSTVTVWRPGAGRIGTWSLIVNKMRKVNLLKESYTDISLAPDPAF